jgi:hypothetical protein
MADLAGLPWVGTMTEYEGYPLAIRARVGWIPEDSRALPRRGGFLDGPDRLDHLAVLTHTFDPTQVKPNGLPRAKYNDSLIGLDNAAHDVLERGEAAPRPRKTWSPFARWTRQKAEPPPEATRRLGLMVLIETCGGRRMYYAAVREASAAEVWATRLRARFPESDIAVEFWPHKAVTWFLRYSDDFNIPLS